MRFFLLAIFSWMGMESYGQNIIGVPEIVNYTKSIYNGGTQNRGIVQDENGVMYFANYEGLLSFDGIYWKIYPLPNKTVVRSIVIGKDGRIYAGGQDEFGYFSPDNNGRLVYTSLKGTLSEKNANFSEIWFVVSFGNDIFFMSREKIFQLSNKIITVYPAATEWLFLGESNGELYAQDGRNGFLEYKNGLWGPFLKNSLLPSKYQITCLFPFGTDSSFVVTVNTGFYVLTRDSLLPFHIQDPGPLLAERVLTAIPVNDQQIAIGTTLNGVYIVNKSGNIIQNLSRKEGLQNNNILKLFLDKNHNLWLGLDNGIDFMAFNNALKHIYPEKLNEGLGYTSIIFGNYLYVGTSNGLYYLPFKPRQDLSFLNGEFLSIPRTKGSTWGLKEINGQLLLGHHDGAFQVMGNSIVPIDTHTAFWTFLPFSSVLPSDRVIAGNDKGISIFQFANGHFSVQQQDIPGFEASSQFMAIDNNHIIWVAHPYRGVYRVDINDPKQPVIKEYTERNGLPAKIRIHLFKIKNRIVVTSEKGVYEYNARLDRFEPSAYFKDLFGDRYIRHLREDDAGNIWFIENEDLGVVDYSGANPEIVYFPELSGKMVADLEHIYPYDPYNIFVGVEKGFYHINYAEYKKNRFAIDVRIRSVRIFGKTDSVLFGGYSAEINDNKQQPDPVSQIANNWNSLHFEFSAPLYVAQSSVRYSYYLEGYDKDWSPWSKKSEKDYTSLPAGKYTFRIKSASTRGRESAVNSYSFVILPPWYFAPWAICVYALIFVSFNYIFFIWLRKLFVKQQLNHQEEQKRLQYLHQLELEKSEKEIVKLKNEKLEAAIEHKNKELASAAMHIVQKGELLGNVREEMMRIKKGINGAGSPEEFKKMLKILNEENKMDKDWEQFAIHFDNVHSDFLRILKETYSNLSAHELKLSAYLRMNLSSKEIAQLENISVRGVEISRYRLRKKLKIPSETNLFEFLIGLHNNNHNGKPPG
jgi:DNA-binding CsgD family transcriptional regulator